VRFEQRELIDILKRSAALQQGSRSSTQQDDRRLRKLGVLDRRYRIGHTRAGRYGSNTRDTGQSGRRISCKHGRGLVARIHDANSVSAKYDRRTA
jgi:hypothetical protein